MLSVILERAMDVAYACKTIGAVRRRRRISFQWTRRGIRWLAADSDGQRIAQTCSPSAHSRDKT